MKYFAIICSIFLFINSVTGQEINIEIGPEMKNKSFFNFKDFIHADETGFFTYYIQGRFLSNKGELFLEKYNHNYEPVFTAQLHAIEKNTRDHGIRFFKNQFIWLTSIHNKPDKRLDFYLTLIDLTGRPQETKLVSTLKLDQNRVSPNVDWKFSPDSSKILIITNIFTNTQNVNFTEYVCVLDNKFNIINEVDFDFQTKAKKTELVDYIITNDGTVFIANRLFKGKRNLRGDYKYPYLSDKRKSATVQIYQLSPGEKSPKEVNILDGQNQLKTLKFAIDNNENVIISGMYGTPKLAGSSGIFLCKLNPDNYGKIFSKQTPLPEKFISKTNRVNVNTQGGKVSSLNNLINTKEITLMENGNLFVIHEGMYTNTKSKMTGNNTPYTEFCSNDKFIMQYDSEGNIVAEYLVPQKLNYEEPDFLGYLPIKKGNQLVLLYNDVEKNIEKNNGPESNYAGNKGKTSKIVNVLADFENSGNYYRTMISSKKDLESVIMPMYSRVLGEDIYYVSKRLGVFKDTGQTYYFGKIKIK